MERGQRVERADCEVGGLEWKGNKGWSERNGQRIVQGDADRFEDPNKAIEYDVIKAVWARKNVGLSGTVYLPLQTLVLEKKSKGGNKDGPWEWGWKRWCRSTGSKYIYSEIELKSSGKGEMGEEVLEINGAVRLEDGRK